MFHDTRRYSPSVIDCSPAASCFAIAPATSRSSIALKAAASIAFRARRSRAALSAGVRRRLPTWSARKGGMVRWVIVTLEFTSPPCTGRGRSPPHLLGNLHDHLQLCPLFFLGEDVAFLGRGETALRRQAQLIQRDIFRRFVDAPLDVVFALERAGLRRDQPEHELLFAFGKEPQRFEPAGAVAVI